METLKFTKNYKLEDKKIFGIYSSFHHLGIIIKNKINTTYENLFFIYDPIQKVEVAFFNLNGLTIEVVCPKTKNSPITKALEKKTFYHHICFSVKDIKKSIEISSKFGVRRISSIVPAVAFEGRNICWCIGKNYGLIELIEE
tara:strand:+ start:317 stop:742 length:426 start_codon:yes stop_codon:yes gene_type:complete